QLQSMGILPSDRAPGSLYFGGTVKTESLLDFEIWLHQADQLGITLSRDDVKKLVAAQAADRFQWPTGPLRDDPNMSRVFRRTELGDVTEDALFEALTKEFRVLIAQSMLLGHNDLAPSPSVAVNGVLQPPAAVTPIEFLQYYRDQRTQLSVVSMPLKVEDFRPEVREQPRPEDLRALFEAYKSVEPTPERDRPGFKMPRRVRVQVLTLKADDPVWRERAQTQMTVSPGLTALALLGGSEAMGTPA